MSLTSSPLLSTRRTFLQAAAFGAVTASMPQLLRADTAAAGDIDAHVHVWTPDTDRYPISKKYKKADMQPASFTPEELFAHSKPVGVDRIVLIQMSFYEFDNQYMLDMIAKYPKNFRGVAIVDETKPDVFNTMRELKKGGVTGFRVYANREATESWVDSKEMGTMWKCAAENGQAMCLLANPDALPAVKKLCKKYPDTRVVIDHFARIGVSGRMEEADLKNLCDLANFKNVYVKTSAFYALGKKKAPYTDLGPMILRLRDAYGANRLMWASDCPYQVEKGHTYAESIALIRDGIDGLTADDKAWILRKTAENVYWS